MKEPTDWELKKWLCDNTVVGLRIHYFQTGTDTSETDWELTPATGKSKRVRSDRVSPLVEVRPDWVRVLSPLRSVVREVEEYTIFAKKEARDLAEFKRLSAKFK